MRERRCIIAILVNLKDFVIFKEPADTERRPLILGEFVIPKIMDFMAQSPPLIALTL